MVKSRSVFIFLSGSKDSTSPGESSVIIIPRYFVALSMDVKFHIYVILPELGES